MTESEYWEKRHAMDTEYHKERMDRMSWHSKKAGEHERLRQEFHQECHDMNVKIFHHRMKEEGVE